MAVPAYLRQASQAAQRREYGPIMRTGKCLSVPARYWWLRSPNPWNANNVRNVNPSGALNNNNANNGYGLAAACFNGPSFE